LLSKKQFQKLLIGFELISFPFLATFKLPNIYKSKSIEEAICRAGQK